MKEISSLERSGRHGIAPMLIAIVVVVIILVAAVAVYFVATPSSSASATTSQSTQSLTTTSSTTSSTSSSAITSSARTSSTGTSSTGSQKVNTYSGTFNYTNPEGPGGERVFSNNTVQTYGSVQSVTGSFTFSINSANYSGTGSGHGTLVLTTTGFCSGNVTVPYVFSIQATQLPGQNITIGFSSPTPANATVPLTCTGPLNGVNTATNNPVPFLAEYAGLVTFAVAPFTESQNLGYGITYYVNITQTG